MFKGKMKAVTFSYDDGVLQDERLISLFNKYGVKGTFNLNSDLLGREGELIREGVRVNHTKVRPEDVAKVYAGHEVAAHTLTHPFLPDIASEEEIVRQVEGDRLALSRLVGYEVVGFAYPGGGINYDSRVANIIKERTGIRYARHTVSSHAFTLQDNLHEFAPTVYHHAEWDALFELGREFVALQPSEPSILYVWGHAYEFDIHNTWDRFEEFLALISGREDIFYGTNSEVLLANHEE